MSTEALTNLAFNFGVPTAILFFILWRADQHFSKFMNHFSTMGQEMAKIRYILDCLADKLGVGK